jgi:nicotinate-nucleotide pyrophosphorylase (carboxylating)
MLNPDLPYLTQHALNHFIDEALREDIGSGDVSSLSSVPAGRISRAELKVKDSGILAGVELAGMIFSRLDPELEMNVMLKDGSRISPGQIAFTVMGSAVSILSAERLVLNCMQRMSGVATRTRHLQDMILHTRARVLDTRKTSPNSRIIEKWAVAIGGGKNHRYALYDMVMLKDNHIDYAGGITAALKACRQYLKENQLSLEIEVETRNLAELKEALDAGLADVIMLDNYSLEDMQQAVIMAEGKIPLEASGNIREETIMAVAETGVDYISVGALTHSYKSLDLSLKAIKE